MSNENINYKSNTKKSKLPPLPTLPKQPEINWSPLIGNKEALEAKEFGHSFGAKKIGMVPSLVNLRFMCRSLAKAIQMHLDFNETDCKFI